MGDLASDDGALKLLEIQALIAEQRVLIEAYRAEVNTIRSESSLSDRRETHELARKARPAGGKRLEFKIERLIETTCQALILCSQTHMLSDASRPNLSLRFPVA